MNTIKYTILNFIIIIIINEYISIKLNNKKNNKYYNKIRRYRRAILQDTLNNNTLPGGEQYPSTIAYSLNQSLLTLTSQEKLEQLQRLKSAELHMRKNLKEKGKEYENQLYEHWPKFIEEMKRDGPDKFLGNPENHFFMYHFAKCNMTAEQIYENWPLIIDQMTVLGTKLMLSSIDKAKKEQNLTVLTYPSPKIIIHPPTPTMKGQTLEETTPYKTRILTPPLGIW